MTVAFVSGLIALAAVIANFAIRDHLRAVAARRGMLDQCRGTLDDEKWTCGGDGVPSLEGRWNGHAVKVALIPDTMVVRRLPQLWLSVTVLSSGTDSASIGVVARHTGNEFYSSVHEMQRRLDPPAGLPLDVLVRGDGAGAVQLCDRLASDLTRLFADPLIKDVTVTSRGARIVRQIAEGRRGEHLLLRQAVFDGATVDRQTLLATLEALRLLLQRRDDVMRTEAA